MGLPYYYFSNGNKFTATIKTPLRFVMACKLPFPVSGTKSFMKTDKDGLNKRRSYRLWKENVMT
jgi:hypothetical protein